MTTYRRECIGVEIFIICLIVIVALLVEILLIKKVENLPKAVENEVGDAEGNEMVISQSSLAEQPIQFELLPGALNIDDARLVEIKDKRVINHFTNLVPESVKVLTNASSAKQYKDVVKAGGGLYQAIIPKGAVLDKSHAMVGASRSSFRGTGKIAGNANLMPVNASVSKMARVNVTNAAMGVGAMIVGQYYMEQINTELKEINESISKITDFQDNEYRSKVFALVAQVQKIADFQVDIIGNEELRIRELSNLDNREQLCIELLGQASLTIDSFSKKQKLNFDQYEKDIIESQKWIVYQNTLLDVLYKIADLNHALNLGSVSREICNALPIKYSKGVKETQRRLKEWHSSQIEEIGIDVEKSRRDRVKLNKVIYKIPGLVNENYNFKPISDETVEIIANQITEGENVYKIERGDLFQNKVKVIAKEGKLYYFPEE